MNREIGKEVLKHVVQEPANLDPHEWVFGEQLPVPDRLCQDDLVGHPVSFHGNPSLPCE
jgi:hypothetical protein